jgi:hypothetical protein
MAQPCTIEDEGLAVKPSPVMSSELPLKIAEHGLAENLVERMEQHWRRFGEGENGFSYPNPETLCVPVLHRACRMFWQKHRELYPRFALSATGGISIEFRRIPK